MKSQIFIVFLNFVIKNISSFSSQITLVCFVLVLLEVSSKTLIEGVFQINNRYSDFILIILL